MRPPEPRRTFAIVCLGTALLAGQAIAQNNGAQTAAAQVELRISQLEDQIRTLTGEVETENHQIQVLTQQLEKMRGDTELRLNDLEGKTGGTPGAPPASAPAADQGTPLPLAPNLPPAPVIAGTPVPGSGPHVLGTLPAGVVPPSAPVPATPAAAATAVPDVTAKQQYQAAFDIYGQGNYGNAEKAFRVFLDQHPKDPLASNAAFWLGESYYARGKFQDAAVAYADGFKKYPKGIKAPDTLLKLGMALGQLGRTQDACTTFAQLGAAPPAIKRQAQQEKTRLKCAG